ncbi:hypothetical protein YZ82_01545 [Campylobacter hyointestinalis]|uniref:Uncharacterized protein n=1 Tax=Campylobacter hyointestinalis TaxID=198 RepID=A0A562XKJ6_CAMHY|nr:hypothetical protein [Campylobacter hyointestinalis]TWO22627.1 hypothetical protein YZ82_01545 [Campylobacter hyointestinalis]
MRIQEFNFFLKSVQDINTLKSDLITRLNNKCDGDNTGYIANVYDISNKKKYLLVSDNVKRLNSLADNLFEFNSDVRNIDLSEYYTKTQSENKFATKEEVANIQAGEGVDLLGYITEELADGKYASKTEIELKANKDSVYNKNEIDEKFRTINISESVDFKNYYTKEEVENKLATLSLTTIQKDNADIKQTIENVYNTLYKKILEVEKLYKGDSIPVVDEDVPALTPIENSPENDSITDESIPKLQPVKREAEKPSITDEKTSVESEPKTPSVTDEHTPVENQPIESKPEKPSVVDKFLEDNDISIVDTQEDKNPALKDFDDVVIFD